MTDRPPGVGCAIAMIGLNSVLMGLLASTFAFFQFSSREQEIWYRYGSLGFLLFGAILPGVALAIWGRRNRILVAALVVWMIFALILCFAYALNSGGGI